MGNLDIEHLVVWRSKSLYGIKSRNLFPPFIMPLSSKYKRGDTFTGRLSGDNLVVLTSNKILIWLWKKLFK